MVLAEWPRSGLTGPSGQNYRMSKRNLGVQGKQIQLLLTVIVADDFPSALSEPALYSSDCVFLSSAHVCDSSVHFVLSLLGLSGDLEAVPHHRKSHLANPPQRQFARHNLAANSLGERPFKIKVGSKKPVRPSASQSVKVCRVFLLPVLDRHPKVPEGKV